MKFVLKFLPAVEYISFRGDIGKDLIALLSKYGYSEDSECSFPLTLRVSGIFHFFAL